MSRKADNLLTIETDLTSGAATEEITKATRDRFGRSIFSSTTPAPMRSGQTAGNARSNSGRSRRISGAGLLLFTRRHHSH